MADKVLDWLLEEENPSVRYLTLSSLMDRSEDEAEVMGAKEAIMTIGVVPALLDLQNEDGSWGKPERFYTDKYRGTVWNLIILAEMRADPKNERVKKACEFILSCSQEFEQGGFSYTQSAKTKTGLPSGVIPCLTGNMVYSLIRLGFIEDSRVQRAIDWICSYQRADDGIEEPPSGKLYERYEACWGRHSCHLGVAKALKALAAIPDDRRSKSVREKIEQLVEYFLIHHIYKKSHDLEKVAKPGWLRFGFPLMYQTDLLELLEIFAELGIKDPRLEDAIRSVANKRNNEGLWKMQNSFNDKILVAVEEKGKPSKWLTLRALKILKFYDEL